MVRFPVAGHSEATLRGKRALAILGSGIPRLLALALAGALIAAGGGIAGGLLALAIDHDGTPPAEVSATATVAPTAVVAAPDSQARIRAVVSRVSPSIVTVIARNQDRVDAAGRAIERRTFGSGIVIDDGGFVITAFHVISEAETISVILSTGEERRVLAVADDSPFSDLAVLRVPADGLRTATLGDSAALRRGDTVIAIAAAGFSFENSVAVGVVSGTGRAWPSSGVILTDLLQTDAAVNSGDSGGALINLDGEVVGLLTTVVRQAPDGTAIVGLAFAQSSNSLSGTLSAILSLGRSTRPRVGFERLSQHTEVNPALAQEQGLPAAFGALVLELRPGSPAHLAGVEPGDIIVGVGGIAVDFENPFVNLLAGLPIGSPTNLQVLRGDQQLIIPVSPSPE